MRMYEASPSGSPRHSALPNDVFSHPTTDCTENPGRFAGASTYALSRTISSVNGFQNAGHDTPAEIEERIAVHSGGVLPVIAEVSTMRRPTRASTLTKVVPLDILALTSAATRGERVNQGEQDDERDEDDRPHGPPTDEHDERHRDAAEHVPNLDLPLVQHEEDGEHEHDDHGEAEDDPSSSCWTSGRSRL